MFREERPMTQTFHIRYTFLLSLTFLEKIIQNNIMEHFRTCKVSIKHGFLNIVATRRISILGLYCVRIKLSLFFSICRSVTIVLWVIFILSTFYIFNFRLECVMTVYSQLIIYSLRI
jgi:hypothetical protein